MTNEREIDRDNLNASDTGNPGNLSKLDKQQVIEYYADVILKVMNEKIHMIRFTSSLYCVISKREY